MKARVVINRHRVKQNKKNKTNIPCISIRTYKGVQYVRELKLPGGWILKQDFENPLCSGATIWLEGPYETIEWG